MLIIKHDINQTYFKMVDIHFVKSEWFSLTWSCGSRQRDRTSSGWEFQLHNLAVKGLKGLAQAKIINKSVILFRVLNMTIWCKHVHRLELQIFIIFVLRIHQLG